MKEKQPMAGNLPVLTPAQARFIRKAVRIRKNLTRKALASRFGVHPRTIERYAQALPKNYEAQVQ